MSLNVKAALFTTSCCGALTQAQWRVEMKTERPPHDTGKVSRVHTRILNLFYDLVNSQKMPSFFTTSRARTKTMVRMSKKLE